MLAVAGVLAFTPSAHAERNDDETIVAAPAAVQRITGFGLRDEAAMVLVGTALIGLAAAVRRAA